MAEKFKKFVNKVLGRKEGDKKKENPYSFPARVKHLRKIKERNAKILSEITKGR